ncbi:MAG: carbohydrate-binding family 9-like protein [Candidatus Omnitrophica bacterium]|nr:carbohydrate-binding family 9-like protein [Candidatus Omnitrophota bacterium]
MMAAHFRHAVLIVTVFSISALASSADEAKTASHNVKMWIASASEGTDALKLDLPRRAKVPKIEGALKLDGKLDEPFWKKAAVLSPFYLNDASAPASESTEVRIAYDDAALYLGWICRDVDIQATFLKRDSKLWEEEVAEFFITPKDLTRYYELQWNPLGTIFDAIINNTLDENGLSKGIQGEWDFTAEGMEASVWVDGTVQDSSDQDRVWQVEVRIPFSAVGGSAPEAGDVWRANFYRYCRTTGQDVEYCSWSPTRLVSFHEPSRFGYLEFQPYSGISNYDQTEK